MWETYDDDRSVDRGRARVLRRHGDRLVGRTFDDEREAEIDARLMNWATVMAGSTAPRCHCTGYGDDVDETRTPNTLDAEVIELVLVRMRVERPVYWKIVQCRYLRRWTNNTAAAFLRRSVSQYRTDVSKTLAWVDGALDERSPALDLASFRV